MDPGAPLFQSIAVSRHADYLDEARHQELLALARAGKPRRWPRLTMHHVIGAILAVLGQRMAGQAAMPTASMPEQTAMAGAPEARLGMRVQWHDPTNLEQPPR